MTISDDLVSCHSIPLASPQELWELPLHCKMTRMNFLAKDSDDSWNLICDSFFAQSEKGKKRGEKVKFNSYVSTALWIPWPLLAPWIFYFLFFVSSVTHHCLMKLETRRNTNLDIAGYLYDIGHVKLTVAVHAHMQAPTSELLQTIAFLPESTADTTNETKKQLQVQVFLFLFVLFTILSYNDNLNLVFLICDCQELGPCINYTLFARSPAGPEDIGNYSLCQRRIIGPLWIRRLVDEGAGAHNPPPKTLTFILGKPLAPQFLDLLLALLLL